MERETGIEPATSSLGSWHSTTELLPPMTSATAKIVALCCVLKNLPGSCPPRTLERCNSRRYAQRRWSAPIMKRWEIESHALSTAALSSSPTPAAVDLLQPLLADNTCCVEW